MIPVVFTVTIELLTYSLLPYFSLHLILSNFLYLFVHRHHQVLIYLKFHL